MDLRKTAFYGILILAFALLFDLLFLAKFARADEPVACPELWAVVQAPANGPSLTATFSNLTTPNCLVELQGADGLYLRAALEGSRFTVIARFPFNSVCVDAYACYAVVGLWTPACTVTEPRIVYADGTSESRATSRRFRQRSGEIACETETFLYGYISGPSEQRTPRWFSATVDLK